MNIFTLLFIRSTGTESQDDKLVVTPVPECNGMFRVTYTTPELRRSRTFVADSRNIYTYIGDILSSMNYDIDPFENIQLSTSIHPTVLYHVSDMGSDAVRDLIIDMIRDSMRFGVTN